MIAKIIAALCIAAVVAFMFQNAAPVTVFFLFWRFDASLAIVVLFSVLAGAIVSAVIRLSGMIRRSMRK